MARRTFNPSLFSRAESIRQAAGVFFSNSKGVLASHSTIISERALQEAARDEARRAVDAGLGSIVLSTNELTAGMNRISADVKKRYDEWRADADKHTVSLEASIADIEQELDELQHRDIPNLHAEKAYKINQIDHEFEASSAYRQNREKYETEKGRFEKLLGYNRNRYPSQIPRLLYWLVLIGIGAGDWVINYYVFITKFEPALAVIVTTLIAAVVAWASHVHVRYFRQRNQLFSLEIFESERRDQRRLAIVMAIALLLVLGFIFWARYSYFAAGAGVDWSSEALFDPGFVLSKVGPTIFFNALIWFVGIVWAAIAHERVPGLREAYKSWQQSDADLEKMRGELTTKKHDIERTYETELMATESRIGECKNRLTNLKTIRNQIAALVESYRGQLVTDGVNLMRQYASNLCAHLINIEKDASAISFVSPRRGRLSVMEYEASDFQFVV